MDSKKKERLITIFFERKSRQVNENETTEPQINSSSVSPDANNIDSSDSVCTGKESISSTTSPEPSSSSSSSSSFGIVNPSNTDLSDKPHQVRLKKFPLREMGNQKRAFNPKWFDEFKFLHYREESDSVICHTCAVADNQNLLKTDTKKERIFIDKGFFKWTKTIL